MTIPDVIVIALLDEFYGRECFPTPVSHGDSNPTFPVVDFQGIEGAVEVLTAAFTAYNLAQRYEQNPVAALTCPKDRSSVEHGQIVAAAGQFAPQPAADAPAERPVENARRCPVSEKRR
jgi:hypothetical protein